MYCRLFANFLIFLALVSCSPARTTFQPETFVPSDELLAVSLAREGLSNYDRNRFVDAEFRLRQALYLAPEADNILLSLAVVLEAQERFDESAEIFARLLEDAPDSIVYMLGAGRSLYRQSKYEEAEVYYKQAYSQAVHKRDFQQAANSARSLSLLNFILGLEIEALCYSTEALEYRESPEEVLRHVRLMTGLHRYESARRLLEDFSSRVNVENDSRFLTLLASLALAFGEYNKVVEYSGRALQMPDVMASRFQLELMKAHAVQYADEVPLESLNLEDNFSDLDSDIDIEEDEVKVEPAPSPAEIVAATRLDLVSTLYWPAYLLRILQAASPEISA